MTKTKSIYLAILSVFLTPMAANADLITASSDPRLAGASLIDFNSEDSGAFTSLSVGGGDVVITNNGGLSISSQYCITYGGGGKCVDNSEGVNFSINFSHTVSAFGFLWGAADYLWYMDIYDSLNNLIETLSISGCCLKYWGAADPNGQIARVDFRASRYDYILLDNLSYKISDSKDVPEPGTLALFGLGLVGMAARRRKTV